MLEEVAAPFPMAQAILGMELAAVATLARVTLARAALARAAVARVTLERAALARAALARTALARAVVASVKVEEWVRDKEVVAEVGVLAMDRLPMCLPSFLQGLQGLLAEEVVVGMMALPRAVLVAVDLGTMVEASAAEKACR